MKKRVWAMAAAVLIAAFIFGCAAKAPVMQDGKQVAIFVLSDRGTRDGMKEDERKDRNEMGQFMEENLVDWLRHEGYNATMIQSRNQYVKGPANYLLLVRINDLRLVGRAARSFAGFTAGPSILKNHYEVSGSGGNPVLSYDDEDSTINDWTNIPRELNYRLAQKITDKLAGPKR
jgi:hypothetical protein